MNVGRWVVVAVLGVVELGGLVCASTVAHGLPQGRCDWADCDGAGGGAAGDTMRECGNEDRAACGGECRAEFDTEHFRCVDRCLAKRCRAPVGREQVERSEFSSDWDADLCLESESSRCAAECRDRPEVNQARCRLDCLMRGCPGSKRSALADESAKPGYTACQRCRAREERECRRSCGAGFSVRRGPVSGVGSYACEKACLIGVCGTECAF